MGNNLIRTVYSSMVALLLCAACSQLQKSVGEALSYVGSEETIADTMLFKHASVFSFEATDESLIGSEETRHAASGILRPPVFYVGQRSKSFNF